MRTAGKVSPWEMAYQRWEEHNPAGSDQLGVTEPDACFAHRRFLAFKPKSHDLPHDNVLDAVEQTFLETLIRRDLQPLSGDSVASVVCKQSVRPWIANPGVVLCLANVQPLSDLRRFLELLPWTVSTIHHQSQRTSRLQPGALLSASTRKIICDGRRR